MKYRLNFELFKYVFIIFTIFIILYCFFSIKYEKSSENFNNYFSFSGMYENLCYFDNKKNDINQNYDINDLKFNLYKCIDYINPDGCSSPKLVDKLEYARNNMNNAYYDSTINPAFSCDCYKLMNIKYKGLKPNIQKIIDEMQSKRSSDFNYRKYDDFRKNLRKSL